ncbi:hypothetical protein CKM354_000633900 [Cercospora kikuchii]|uniref:Fucose-specific lectin n=1 Tax=Cercospora kikuchii TaxID=84275 RepID=A0A9P3CHR3_9PEZI|nr:uncharacterized protein CKM354_000633900 [Cercospora kikuchii]GIZ43099.1 hypothetical protein CKM354_000633900 [Cercospora kikuchii]
MALLGVPSHNSIRYTALEGMEVNNASDTNRVEQAGLEPTFDREAAAPELLPTYLCRTPSRHSHHSPEPYYGSRYIDSKPGQEIDDGHIPAWSQESGTRKSKTYCGLRRRAVIAIAVILTVLVIVAIVVGAVLGAKSSGGSGDKTQGNSSVSPLVIRDGGGLATVTASSAVLAYYQAENGSIVESRMVNDTDWQVQSAIPTRGASPGTSIAASSITLYVTSYVLVFYTDNDGEIMMTNRTSSSPEQWSEPISVLSNDGTQPGTSALQVNLYPGFGEDPVTIRVYYGSATPDQGIRELGMGSDNDYAVASWNGFAKYSFLNQSDPNSGVGATSLNELARLYVRNSTTGYLAQWALGWGTEVEGWWQTGSSSSTDPLVANSSSITACNDQASTRTDYVFYQSITGTLVCAISASDRGFTSFHVLSEATPADGTKLHAWYDDSDGEDGGGGATLFYQDSGAQAELKYLKIRRTGEVQAMGSVRSSG